MIPGKLQRGVGWAALVRCPFELQSLKEETSLVRVVYPNCSAVRQEGAATATLVGWLCGSSKCGWGHSTSSVRCSKPTSLMALTKESHKFSKINTNLLSCR